MVVVLPAPFGPQEAEDLALADIDREVVQGAHNLAPAARREVSLAVVLGQTLRLDDGHGRRLRTARRQVQQHCHLRLRLAL